jgi:hypothetical protein
MSFADLSGAKMETVAVSTGAGLETLAAELVAGGYFSMLRVPFRQGAAFSISDASRGAPLVAVVNERYWRRQLGSDPRIPGRTVFVNNVPLTVVGVLSPDFTGTDFPVS